MPHHNTVFADILKFIPWQRFESLVEEYDADARVRRLSTKGQFLALLYGQLSGASGLREIVTGLSSHAARLYHLGADPVRRSTFSDANTLRPAEVFAARVSGGVRVVLHVKVRRLPYDNRKSSNRRPSVFSSFFTALEATTSSSLA